MDNYDLINGKLYKKCPPEKIRNPLTLRCVNIHKKIGKRILKNKDEKECPPTKIFNPLTKRCISIKSKLGRNLLGLAQKSNPTSKPLSNTNKEKVLELINKLKTELIKSSKSINVYKKSSPFKPILSPIIESPSYSSSIKSSSPSSKYPSSSPSSSSPLSLSKSISSVKNYDSFLSDNIISFQERIQFNNQILKLLNITHDNQKKYCMRFLKFDKNNNPIYIINDNIILKNKIGNDNIDSILYFSQIYDSLNNKILKYSSKLVLQNPTFLNELYYLSILSNSVLQSHSPHFPILYANLECRKFASANPPVTDLSLYPRIIKLNPNKSFSLILTELYNGNLKTFLNNKNHLEFIINSLIQCIISLLFFYKETKSFYNNIHPANINYLCIHHNHSKSSFLHYNIFDFHFYLPNQGFLWILSNFKKPVKFTDANLNHIFINQDIKELIKLFIKLTPNNSINILSQFYDFINLNNDIYSPQNIITFIKKIFNFLKKNKLVLSSIPTNSNTLNSSPFSIHISHFK